MEAPRNLDRLLARLLGNQKAAEALSLEDRAFIEGMVELANAGASAVFIVRRNGMEGIDWIRCNTSDAEAIDLAARFIQGRASKIAERGA